jgi:hypothetical protein
MPREISGSGRGTALISSSEYGSLFFSIGTDELFRVDAQFTLLPDEGLD